jgi:two-component system, NtrC family, sensor kinase
MKGNIPAVFLALCAVNFSAAQTYNQDSIPSELSGLADTTKVNILSNWWDWYTNPDSTIHLARQGLLLAQKIGYKEGEYRCKISIGINAWALGDYSTAIKMGYEVLPNLERSPRSELYQLAHWVLMNGYRDLGDYKQSLAITFELLRQLEQLEDCMNCGIVNAAIGSDYYGLSDYDSAMYYFHKAMTYEMDPGSLGWTLLMVGRTLDKLNDDSAALKYLHTGMRELKKSKNLKDLAGMYNSLASLYEKVDQPDSAIRYARDALSLSAGRKFNKELADAYVILSTIYQSIDNHDALRYYKLAVATKDSLYNQEKQRQITSLRFEQILQENEANIASEHLKNTIRTYVLSGLLIMTFIVIGVLYRANQVKQKARQKTEDAYVQLKSTQSQLIQSEKMASLGELTAGIAHEIQNPLNFVNNFSEVNTELAGELLDAVSKGNMDEVQSLAKSIKNNGDKISSHGRRADGIVKSMLQHSRAGSGQKVLTDINALCDKYLRLAYHGFRAKNKSFNAAFKTDLDPSLPKAEVVPQDIGRVILNLINNAFHAVGEKAKTQESGYEPEVTVSTTRTENGIQIKVKDNGPGIPDNIKEKIFQPFFTTKPAGHGTGLGLSLSYDIVKAHGGEIRIAETKEAGAELLILLPDR